MTDSNILYAKQQERINLVEFQIKVITTRDNNARFCKINDIPFEVSNMTPNEELFRVFFAEGTSLVKDKDDLELRAFRQELEEIALKAHAYAYAADEEQKDRTKKNKSFNAPTRNLEQDEISSNAINAIKTRKEKLSKTDKAIENLMKLPGMTREMAEQMYAPKKLLEIRDRKAKEPEKSVTEIINDVIGKKDEIVESKPFVNPFAKKG